MDRSEVKAIFGARVRWLRNQRGWSQEEFAKIVGLDRSYVGGVERGERNISLENISMIAEGFSVSLSELFNYENAPSGAVGPRANRK
jgi:transcriptional regulator with XRE-family HTH domain